MNSGKITDVKEIPVILFNLMITLINWIQVRYF